MKNKSKGFTLVEVIISLALTVVILGVVGTFFIINSKTISEADARSTLQREGETIQNSLIDKVGQCDKISSLSIGAGLVDSSTVSYSTALTDLVLTDSAKVDEIVFHDDVALFSNPSDDNNVTFNQTGNRLTLTVTESATGNILSEKVLSENVDSFKIIPLDLNNVPNRATTHFNTTPGIKVVIVLKIKKGYTNVTYPVNTIVKFRNRNASFN